ncbi:MAG TPA: hypothetical protein VNZ53_04680 [Steroidobacteraceae bacterium]|jgi:hypothetical protein|nr:hypothetical protein [Steroidobacteraceae bacterium]
MIGKNSLNILGRRRFLEAAARAFAMTQIELHQNPPIGRHFLD